jgi:antitoxin component of MazEF toxin-antitoxin module
VRQVWATRFVKLGGSAAVVLPKEVREKLGVLPGDLIVMRLYGKILIARRLDPTNVIDVSSIPADALPSAVRS